MVWWALQFTPRVARMEEALVLELSGSLRLFGGRDRLQQRVLTEVQAWVGAELAVLAWAPTSRAALLLSRGAAPGEAVVVEREQLQRALDRLPLQVLTAATEHMGLLHGVGCRSVGDLRRLPRAAVVRRVGPAVWQELEAASGQGAETHAWCQAPECFEAKRELPERCDQTQAVLHAATPLLQAACLWLGARHAGATELQFGWCFDAMRARDLGAGGRIHLRASTPHRRLHSWQRLLATHLQQQALAAPVSDLWVRIERSEALPEATGSLLAPSAEAQRAEGESLDELLTRLSVRLGKAQVRQASLVADHRSEYQQRWVPWQDAPRGVQATPWPQEPAQWPQPSWLLNPPQALRLLGEQPLYMGLLELLAGPQRVEAGWWSPDGGAVCRDYFVAHSRLAGLLWIYRERGPGMRGQPAGFSRVCSLETDGKLKVMKRLWGSSL